MLLVATAAWADPPNFGGSQSVTALSDSTGAPYTGSNPVPVTGAGGGVSPAPVGVAPTDRGGTLTVGGTAQNAAASNASRKGFVIQNPCTAAGEGIAATEDLYVSVTGSATVAGATNFADLPPCGSTSLIVAPNSVITAAVSVNATTIGHRWSATEVQ